VSLETFLNKVHRSLRHSLPEKNKDNRTWKHKTGWGKF